MLQLRKADGSFFGAKASDSKKSSYLDRNAEFFSRIAITSPLTL